ncbi:MAG: ABC transporter permease [Planctomycetes bacterium]|nr:ABC transporter permease [Planctomycetota bacterium]
MALEGGGGESKEAVGSASDAPQGFFAGFEARDYWLVSIALIVCFVGIVNAMLMSVTERFREIGTMKCLGALDSFIVKLFVLESMFQGSLGTFMGIILGVVLSILRAWWLYGSDNFRFFPWSGMLACMALSQAVGTLLTIVAATFPARAAARMQPVDALRAEQ